MGLQLENVVLNNRKLIHQALNIDPNIVIQDNPVFNAKLGKLRGVKLIISSKPNIMCFSFVKSNVIKMPSGLT